MKFNLKKIMLSSFMGGTLLIGFLFIAVIMMVNSPEFQKEQQEEAFREKLQFEIFEKKDVSLRPSQANALTRINYKAFLKTEKLPSKEDIEFVANKIVSNDPYIWDEIAVFIYLPETSKKSISYARVDFEKSKQVNSSIFGVQGLYCTKWHPTVKPDNKLCIK